VTRDSEAPAIHATKHPGMDRRRFLLTSLAGSSPRYRRFLKRGSKPARKLESPKPKWPAALRRPQSFVSKCESANGGWMY
jgi:hypothetical protein